MCGLIALVNKWHGGLTKDQTDAFNDLLYIDALRGMDSTGVFVVDKTGEMNLAKEASAAHDFRQQQDYRDLLQKAFRTGRAIVGHNRAATKGSITDQNAHPFVVDDRITLVHNGTLWGDFNTLTKEKVDVDSHAIAHVIHENGDDVEKAVQQLSGAYALIWHDFKKNSLNFLRNSQRPLNYIEVESGWIWASEHNMLAWILNRYDLKPKGNITTLTPGDLVTYDFANTSCNMSVKPINLEAPKPPYQTTYRGGRRHGNHPYANAYEDGNNWYGNDLDGEVEDVIPIPHKQEDSFRPPQRSTNVVALVKQQEINKFTDSEKAQQSNRIRISEEEIAFKMNIDIPVESFNICEKEMKEGASMLGKCFDFDYVAAKDNSQGYFLYAQLIQFPNYMIRIHLPSTFNETDLLDLTLNARNMMFKLAGRSWRAYQEDKSRGRGFATIRAVEMREIVVPNEKKEVLTNA